MTPRAPVASRPEVGTVHQVFTLRRLAPRGWMNVFGIAAIVVSLPFVVWSVW